MKKLMLIGMSNIRSKIVNGVIDYIDNIREKGMPEIKITLHHEGDRSAIERENGVIEIIEIGEFADTITVDKKEIINENVGLFQEKVFDIGYRLGSEQANFARNIINKAVEKVGNIVEYKNVLGPEHIFEMLEKVQIDFDEKDNPIKPGFWADPNTGQKILEILKTIEDTPELLKKHDEIIEKKRIEYHDRESHRKLVG
ncbi:MAG: hypothetical protein KDC73_04995 [Ignavibacteriae bacterium]|nr:hypothetical protein [Ignavibacteriota bacterium]MCB9243920.1 hypothetical protein [Ignavibacteriales bacterium]